MNKLGFKVFIIINVIMAVISILGIIYSHSLFWLTYLIVLIANYYYRLIKDPDFKQYVI